MAGKWMRLVGVPVAALGVVGIAACGTSAAGATGGSSGGGPGGGADMQALTACLAENGVTLPEGGPGGSGGTPPRGTAKPDGGTPPTGTPGAGGAGQAPPGVDATTWAKAQQACAQYAPTGGPGAGGATATS